MIVSQAKYDAMVQRAIRAEAHGLVLIDRWNKLVERINKKGGEHFLNNATLAKAPLQLTQDELTRLILLCHPDKHSGKAMAVEMTQKLLALKKETTMTIYQRWHCRHEPTNRKGEQYVATYAGRTLTAATMIALQRKIDLAMDEAYS